MARRARKLRSSDAVPTAIAHRLSTWGRCIRAQRVAQHIKAADLCTRMNISQATLRRVEQGDPGASASTYLTALWVLACLKPRRLGLTPNTGRPSIRSLAQRGFRQRILLVDCGHVAFRLELPRGSPRAPRRLVEPHRTHVSRRYRRNDAAGIGLPAPYSNAGIDSVFSRSGVAISAPLDITPCLPSNAARSDSGQYSPTSRSLGNEVISAVLNPTLSTEMICAASRRYPPESDWRP